MIKYTVEHAPYTVLESSENIELRRYDQLVLVSTYMKQEQLNGPEREDDSAFRRLFKYISGDNTGDEDISMTAPVFMDPMREEKMSFVLPEFYSLETAPQPLNNALDLEVLNDYVVAAIRFNGRLDPETVKSQTAELQNWLTEQNIESAGKAMIAGYDPPSSLPWFRRNEVLIPIRISGSRK